MASENGQRGAAEAKQKRLAAALRENLKRRKAQQRGRALEAASQGRLESAARLGDKSEF
jgi:hypothetical protein